MARVASNGVNCLHAFSPFIAQIFQTILPKSVETLSMDTNDATALRLRIGIFLPKFSRLLKQGALLLRGQGKNSPLPLGTWQHNHQPFILQVFQYSLRAKWRLGTFPALHGHPLPYYVEVHGEEIMTVWQRTKADRVARSK